MDDLPPESDCVIVGAGIAGLSAGLFLARASKSPILFDGGRKRIETVSRVREFIGFDGQSPEEVLEKARSEALKYGATIRRERVQTIEPRPDGRFDVSSESGTVTARAVILATGVVDHVPSLRGVSEKWGDSVRVCPCFDGYEVRNQRFVVFGKPQRLAHQAAWVSVWSPDVTVVTDHTFDSADAEKLDLLGVKVIPGEVTEVMHSSGEVSAVKTNRGNTVPCDAAWIVMDPESAGSPLAAGLCDVDDQGVAIVDSGGQTSRPGLFCVGNASFAWGHMAHAAASGTNVGPVVAMYLLDRHIEELRQQRTRKG